MFIPIKITFLKSFMVIGLLIFCINVMNAQPFECTIKGNVSDTTVMEFTITKSLQSAKDKIHNIKIKDGKFNYSFEFDPKEAYRLNWEDPKTSIGWHIPFFPTDGELNFTLYPFENENYYLINKIEGGKFNQELMAYWEKIASQYQNQIDQLYAKEEKMDEAGILYNDSTLALRQNQQNGSKEDFYRIYRILKKMSANHNDKTTEGKILALKIDSLSEAKYTFTSDYIKHNQNIFSYYLLLKYVKNDRLLKPHFKDIQQNFELLSPKFPNHPYTHFIEERLKSFKLVKVGKEFIDFTVPDLNGNHVTFSDKLEGKITLLDLWGSWCRSCIVTSRTVIPIYETYKERGFNVIGVAREFKNTQALERTLEREKFPWLNLLELDDQQDLWLKYGIPNSGGMTFLIDRDGKILAISPEAEEIVEILEKKL